MTQTKLLDNKTTSYCEVHRGESGTTVCAVCLNCAKGIISDRRTRFPKSEGAVYMRRRFGRALMNSLPSLRKATA